MPVLRVLALTEDGSDKAHDVLVSLSKAMVKLAVAGVQTQAAKLQFDETRPDARKAMKGNRWRSEKEEDLPHIRALQRAIATHLLIEDDDGRPAGFVFFHYDGDVPYAAREGCNSEQKWQAFQTGIEQHIRHKRPRLGEKELAAILGRLVAVVPFYCIESWTYQHTYIAKQICEKSCGKHLDEYDCWAADRGRLDEIAKPWDPSQLPSCLGKDFNVELAGAGYPAEAVWAVEKSFHATLERLMACPALIDALERTKLP